MQKSFTMDKTSLTKIGKGILIAMGGAGLTYLAQYVGETDFGVYTPIVVMVMSIIINATKEYISGK
jgi:hypothetical protein